MATFTSTPGHVAKKKRTMEMAVESEIAETEEQKKAREDITRKKLEDKERAFIAASRRTDRSIEKRLESAYSASKTHEERTGKPLRITREAVEREEMYDEVDDGFEQRRRRRSEELALRSQSLDQSLQQQYNIFTSQRYGQPNGNITAQFKRGSIPTWPPGQAIHGLAGLSAMKQAGNNSLSGTASHGRSQSLPNAVDSLPPQGQGMTNSYGHVTGFNKHMNLGPAIPTSMHQAILPTRSESQPNIFVPTYPLDSNYAQQQQYQHSGQAQKAASGLMRVCPSVQHGYSDHSSPRQQQFQGLDEQGHCFLQIQQHGGNFSTPPSDVQAHQPIEQLSPSIQQRISNHASPQQQWQGMAQQHSQTSHPSMQSYQTIQQVSPSIQHGILSRSSPHQWEQFDQFPQRGTNSAVLHSSTHSYQPPVLQNGISRCGSSQQQQLQSPEQILLDETLPRPSLGMEFYPPASARKRNLNMEQEITNPSPKVPLQQPRPRHLGARRRANKVIRMNSFECGPYNRSPAAKSQEQVPESPIYPETDAAHTWSGNNLVESPAPLQNAPNSENNDLGFDVHFQHLGNPHEMEYQPIDQIASCEPIENKATSPLQKLSPGKPSISPANSAGSMTTASSSQTDHSLSSLENHVGSDILTPNVLEADYLNPSEMVSWEDSRFFREALPDFSDLDLNTAALDCSDLDYSLLHEPADRYGAPLPNL
ncbi:hypothetical protein AJ79_03267 [Helicocarpus griseus UAMH5409]|uniref:Uncharacterized protein n=1 Tax=Helicocarpus griseus UAMH5409 TaxID=1447875 RepID=A0A2B7XZK3_9EURO|nr:hypothetical protein AJ79_03267 [Helicocarpus griseus UAMH5409]